MTLKDLRLPPLRDARYLQTLILTMYAFAARQFFNFERPHFVTVLCVAWAVALDLLVGRFYFKRLNFPLSAVIIGLASSLLVDVRTWPLYLVIVTISVLSKAFITHRGRHIFNPTNFGVVLAMQLLPGQVAAIPSLFGSVLWPSIVFGVLGVLTVISARQTAVSFAWIGGVVLFGIYRSLQPGGAPWVVLGRLVSSSFLLFSFHMISDPGSTPRTVRYQVAFGLLAAFLDGLLRIWQVPHGQFYALFAAAATLVGFRRLERQENPRSAAV